MFNFDYITKEDIKEHKWLQLGSSLEQPEYQ